MWGWQSWWHWLAMSGLWMVVLGLAVWAAVHLFPSPEHRSRNRARLDERLARGDLDVEQYRLLRGELERR